MKVPIRSCATAGVALAGAAVIVAGPIAPPPDVQIPAVQNAAGAEPLPSDAIWQKSPIVYEAIFDPARIKAIIAGTDVLADPGPVAQQLPDDLVSDAVPIGGAVVNAGVVAISLPAVLPLYLVDAATQAAVGDYPATLHTLAVAAGAPLAPPLVVAYAVIEALTNSLPAGLQDVGTLVREAANALILNVIEGGDAVVATASTLNPVGFTNATTDVGGEQDVAAGVSEAPVEGSTPGLVPEKVNDTLNAIEDASDPSTSPTALAERVGSPLIKPSNKFEPGKVGAEAAKPGERATTALKAAGDQIRTSVLKFGDTLRKLTGNGGKSSGGSEAGASAGGTGASGASAGGTGASGASPGGSGESGSGGSTG